MIKQIIKSISSRTDAPDIFVKSAAYAIMSNNLGRFIEVPLTNRVMKLNMYMVFVGPAHISRKSTILSYIKRMSLNMQMSSDVTYQFFLEKLSENPIGWQCVDEVSEIFQQYLNSTNSYHKNMLRAYLMLYSNESLERGTRGGGLVTVHDAYFNFIGATTNDSAFTYITNEHAINSGFVPRILMPVVTETELKNGPMIYTRDEKDIITLLDKFKEWRKTLSAMKEKKVKIWFNDDTFEMVNDFSYDIYKRMKHSHLLPVASRYSDYIFKISALEELNVELEERGHVPMKLMVSIKSMKKAIAYISEILVRLEENFSEFTDYNNFSVAYRRILAALKRGIHTEAGLFRSASTDAITTKKVINTLKAQKKIFIRIVGKNIKYYINKKVIKV